MRTQNFTFELLTDGNVKIHDNHTDGYTITDRNELLNIYHIIGKILFKECDADVSELVDRIFELIDPWDRYDDSDKMKQDIGDAIREDPKAIINDLLDRLENMI